VKEVDSIVRSRFDTSGVSKERPVVLTILRDACVADFLRMRVRS